MSTHSQTNTPGHPWDHSRPDCWEHFAFTSDTNAELGEQIAMFCLAGWTVWAGGDELIHTPDGMRFGAVMYRAKNASEVNSSREKKIRDTATSNTVTNKQA